MDYFEDLELRQQDYIVKPLPIGEYQWCQFVNCNFEGTNLSKYRFIDCEFIDCNLSNTKLYQTAFQDIKFKKSKLLGVQFEHCNPFSLSFSFQDCILDHASFYRCKLKKTQFINSRLYEADFSEADLTAASFAKSDLERSTFHRTNLEKADFETAINYQLDPEMNVLTNARFSKNGLAGLLKKFGLEIVP